MASFARVYQPAFEEVFRKDYKYKGNWAREVFGNQNPIVLELGCGKGEYTINLARRYPDINFIGVDIKGARIWKGAKTAHEQHLDNVAFLRTRIEIIESFFGEDEINEIWLTFPDPQLKRRRKKKRLTGARFLNQYRNFLVDNGIIHLKTDNDNLYHYTIEIAAMNKLSVLRSTGDLYHSEYNDDALAIKTYYEIQYLEEGSNINYLKFALPKDRPIIEPPDDE